MTAAVPTFRIVIQAPAQPQSERRPWLLFAKDTPMTEGRPVPGTSQLFATYERALIDRWFGLDWILVHTPTETIIGQHRTRRAAIALGRDLFSKLGADHWRGDKWLRCNSLGVVMGYVRRQLAKERQGT